MTQRLQQGRATGMGEQRLLIVEDGDEYLRFFSRHLSQFAYVQAHSHSECLAHLEDEGHPVDGIILDIRFDRVPKEALIGDLEEIADRMGLWGEVSEQGAVWQYVIDNQGYLILQALREKGFLQPALIIADLPQRQVENLERMYGAVGVVGSFDRQAIEKALSVLIG